MDPDGPFAKEWALIERLITATCRKRGLRDADADDFASNVRLKFLADDCAVLRDFRGDAKLSTYLNVIVQRTYADYCIQERGKWHASAVAKRLGDAAMKLERLLVRDGWSSEAAISRVLSEYPTISRSELEEILARLPQRCRRQRPVPLETVADVLPHHDQADSLLILHERLALSEKTAAIVRGFLADLEEHDRLLLQWTFERNLQISKIARLLAVDQKPLYRRRDALLHELREVLLADGVTSDDARDLIGHVPDEADFGLRKTKASPSERSGDDDEEVTP